MRRAARITLGIGLIACGEPEPARLPPAGHRVVSLSPVGTEIVVSLGSGARLVAVDRESASLPSLRGLPVTDAAHVGEFEPDLVLVPGLEAAEVRAAASDAKVIEVAPQDLNEAYALCRTIGTALFRGMEARRFVRKLSLPLAQISAESFGQRRPRVAAVLEIDPLVLAGGHSFATDLIEIAGAESVTHGVEEPGPVWSRADLERVAPELVVVVSRRALIGPERARALETFGPGMPVEFLVFDPDRFWLSDSLPVARRMRGWIEPLSKAGRDRLSFPRSESSENDSTTRSETRAQDGGQGHDSGGRQSVGDQQVDLSKFVRPFDDSDPEMRDYLELIDVPGGCRTMPRSPCPDARIPFKDGGERLARYMIHHVEASEAEGYPARAHYLNQIAMTETEAGFRFLRDRVRNRGQLRNLGEAKAYIHALARTHDERVFTEALTLLEEEGQDSRLRVAATAALFLMIDKTESRRPDVLERLRSLRTGDRVSEYVTQKMQVLGIE